MCVNYKGGHINFVSNQNGVKIIHDRFKFDLLDEMFPDPEGLPKDPNSFVLTYKFYEM